MSPDIVLLERLKAELELDAERMNELRRFRYVFRNMYANDLDPRRVAAVQEEVPSTVAGFQAAHEVFLSQLTEMIDELESTFGSSSHQTERTKKETRFP